MAAASKPSDVSTSSVSAPSVRAPAELGHLAVELGRRRDEHDLAVVVVLDQLGELVGLHLLVVADPSSGEEHVPLAALAGEDLLPLGQGPLGEQLVEHAGRRPRC